MFLPDARTARHQSQHGNTLLAPCLQAVTAVQELQEALHFNMLQLEHQLAQLQALRQVQHQAMHAAMQVVMQAWELEQQGGAGSAANAATGVANAAAGAIRAGQ